MTRLSTLALAALLPVAAAGCDDRPVHAFGAHRYDVQRDCLEEAAAHDVVEGEPRECPDTRCWIAATGDVYVTTTACDAPPDFEDHTADAEGSVCAKALAAHAADLRCP